MFRTRDFIETREGLLFSVVLNLHPVSGIISQLRFRRTSTGLVKIGSTQDSYQFLSDYPGYVQFCPELDRDLVIVPRDCVMRHYNPTSGLIEIMKSDNGADVSVIVSELLLKSGLHLDDLGITGSYLIGAQDHESDIDLVIYGLDTYNRLVLALQECVEQAIFSPLDRGDWQRIYQKRGLDATTGYTFREFLWHESRKWNRAKLGKRRFDLLSGRRIEEITGDFQDFTFKRLGEAHVECKVIDSSLGFDYPARYQVSNCNALCQNVREIVSFTHTYIDQVREGEVALCAGILEKVSGKEDYYRILIGSSREATGEFLKVKGVPPDQ